jgi:hypothetical protein
MTDENIAVASIIASGVVSGQIYRDQTVKWIAKTGGSLDAQRPYVEMVVREAQDNLASIASVYAALTLSEVFQGTGVRIVMHVSLDYGVDSDVIE